MTLGTAGEPKDGSNQVGLVKPRGEEVRATEVRGHEACNLQISVGEFRIAEMDVAEVEARLGQDSQVRRAKIDVGEPNAAPETAPSCFTRRSSRFS